MPSLSLFLSRPKKADTGEPKKSQCQWMELLGSTALADAPLYNLFIPGSHDSGAYQLYPGFGFAVDRPDLRKSWFLNAFHFLTYPLVARYSITQRLSVYQQLEAGVRYLDLRVALRPEDGQLYIAHNFYGPKLEEILRQIGAYVAAYPKEILLLDFQHVHNFNAEEDHRRLADLLVAHLGTSLVPTSCFPPGSTLSLRSLWSSGRSVLAFYRHPFQRSLPNLLWPTELLPNPWANTRSILELSTFLQDNIPRRPADTLYVTQGVLTPNSGYVLRHFFGSLESKLTRQANPLLNELIVKQRLGTKGKDPKDRSPYGANIVMFDFIHWKRYQLIESLVALNAP